MAFAHDKELRSGFLQDTPLSPAKDIMVQPNPPRFLREGDALEFTVKVTNLSATRQQGSVRLTFANARTLQSVDTALGLTTTDKPFEVPAKESRTYAWQISVPDGVGFLQYKVVGSTGKLSDGEEGYLPVLSPAASSSPSPCPCPSAKPAAKDFRFAKLAESANLRHPRPPEPCRPDGLQSLLVRRHGSAVPHGIRACVQRADL